IYVSSLSFDRDLFFLSVLHVVVFCLFFFFQAEDGIRDKLVTGVQTCALPISYGATAGLCPSTRSKYSANVVEMAPSAAARMMASSAQPNRKAGRRPHASRRKT